MDLDVKNIVNKMNYLTPSRYISGRIVEYDIKSANISTLVNCNAITEDDYKYLYNLPKQQREIEIGLRIKKDPTIYNKIRDGIIEAKENLIDFNKISEDQIVRIANDAVYINSELDLNYTKFGKYIEFKQKSIYNIYLKLNSIVIFLKYLDNGDIDIDIKGLGTNNMDLHKDYMIYTIISTVLLLERSGVNSAIEYLSGICEKYVCRELDMGYYREFNPASEFRVNYTLMKPNGTYYDMGVFSAVEDYKNYLDINYNYAILRELWSILVEIYSIRTK